jgi:hypothetical protein
MTMVVHIHIRVVKGDSFFFASVEAVMVAIKAGSIAKMHMNMLSHVLDRG